MKTKKTTTTTIDAAGTLPAANPFPFPNVPNSLITMSNSKMLKSLDLGISTAILHLASADSSGFEVCPNRSTGCTNVCLNKDVGNTRFDSVESARIKRTIFLFEHKELFMAMLHAELTIFEIKTRAAGLVPAFRPNGTSDLPFLSFNVAKAFPTMQVYDYTKNFKTLMRKDIPANLDFTFSRSETNAAEWKAALELGYRVAIVSDLTGDELREYLDIAADVPILNGDEHDATFTRPRRCVLLLKPKGRATKDNTGFALLRKNIFPATAKVKASKNSKQAKWKASKFGDSIERAAAMSQAANPKLWAAMEKAGTTKAAFLAMLNNA